MARVIAGTAKNFTLKSAPAGTRPLTDRIKTSLFDLIRELIPDSRVLDLYSGSGAFGIEALSRGAVQAYFVDSSQDSINIIKNNLRATRLDTLATVIHDEVGNFLRSDGEHYDIIFADPPFSEPIKRKNAILLLAAKRLTESGLFAARYPSTEQFPKQLSVNSSQLTKIYEKKYGKSRVAFYRTQFPKQ